MYGSFQTEAGHGGDGDDLFYTVEARYTDLGTDSVAPLTGRAGHILQPKRKQAEALYAPERVLLETTGDEAGGGAEHRLYRPRRLDFLCAHEFRGH